MPGAFKKSGAGAILLAAVLWSTGGLFIKEVRLDAWGVSCWRSGFAGITLFVIYWLRMRHSNRIVPDGRVQSIWQTWLSPLTLWCAFLYSAMLVLFVIATKLTTSANAIFLQYTAPIYLLFAEPMLTGSKRRRSDTVVVAISTLAMGLFFLDRADLATAHLLGNIAALASGVAFAGYTLMMKHERATEATRWQTVIVGHIAIVTLTLILGGAGVSNLMPTGIDFARLAFLGVIQIGAAYAFFTFGVGQVRAIDATLISMVEPVLNPIWVYFGIGERPSNLAIVGGVIILTISIVRTLRGEKLRPVVQMSRPGE